MTNQGDLAHRFVFGSNYISPGSPESDFFYGIPHNLKRANQLGGQLLEIDRKNAAVLTEIGEQLLEADRQTLRTLQSNHAENTILLNEIGYSINQLSSVCQMGFERVEDAITRLEESVCAELGEIKCILAQLDDKFATLLHLVKFPRETEAAELVSDGLKAFSTNNFGDAEDCFRKAIEKKRISFQAHLNLAFLLLHNNTAEEAITHFKKAVDYAPIGLDILALENLARAHFAAKDYSAARQTMNDVLELRKTRRLTNLRSYYHSAIYGAWAGGDGVVDLVLRICKEDPGYFALAGKDKDFSVIRPQLFLALEELGRTEFLRAKNRHATLKNQLEDVGAKFGASIQAEVKQIEHLLADIEGLIIKEDYTHSHRANEVLNTFLPEAETVIASLYELQELRGEILLLQARVQEAVESQEQAILAYGLNEENHENTRERSRKKRTGKESLSTLSYSGFVMITALIMTSLGAGTVVAPFSILLGLTAGGFFLYRSMRYFEGHSMDPRISTKPTQNTELEYPQCNLAYAEIAEACKREALILSKVKDLCRRFRSVASSERT